MSKKILIVDDDELTVHLLTSRLQDSGYVTLSAGTGEEALKMVIAEKPDVVIMDIMLPDMQGSDVVKMMQEHEDVSENMKIVFLSGIISKSDDEGEKIQVAEKSYPAVAKPIDFEQLLSLIK